MGASPHIPHMREQSMPAQAEGLPSLPASALSGRLFLEGRLGGSLTSPELQLDARIEGAALGATMLKQVGVCGGGGRGEGGGADRGGRPGGRG